VCIIALVETQVRQNRHAGKLTDRQADRDMMFAYCWHWMWIVKLTWD